MRREVRNQNHGRCEDDPIVKDEAKSRFPEVERHFIKYDDGYCR